MTSVEDALLCADAGADAIGVIFFSGSKRFIDVARAREIVAALPAFVTPVGLFTDAGVDEVRKTCAELRLRHVQLHGDESVEMVRELSEFRILKAVRVGKAFEAELKKWREAKLPNLCALLMETAAHEPGGTGIENDWSAIERAQKSRALAGLPPVVAAGGLHAGNVGEVVRRLQPWAVDACSGTEEKAGKKSKQKVCEFVEAVARA